MKDFKTINWNNPQDKISRFFTVKEALWLPNWKILAIPTDSQKEIICKLAEKLDKVRDLLGPCVLHCWLRTNDTICLDPKYLHKNYNLFVGGALGSMHITGGAADFHIPSITCDEARSLLLPKLEEFNIRLEDKPKSNWLHIDIKEVLPGMKRFFKP
jgi:uncharacterized protein YcbK (DUF882 family)